MKSFDEVVYCKTQEEWDAVVDWADSDSQRENFKDNFDVYDNICVNHNKISNLLNYGSLELHKNREEQYGKVITFQEFKDKYLKETEGTSQSPSESEKFKSDGGSSDYYKITLTNKAGESIKVEMGDIIRQAFNNDFDLGNIVKACRRITEAKQGRGKAGVDIAYDANKIIYFANEIKEWDK